jgi:hypothetical protein
MEMSILSRHKTFYDFFPVPDFLLLAASGVALSDESVKLVEFKKGGKHGELRLLHASESLLPKGAMEGGVIHNKEAVVGALKEFRERLGVKYTRAVLPEEKAYLFTAHIEEVPQKDVRDAVAFIVEENAPVSLEESVFDYEVIGKFKGYSGIKVAVSVMAKSVVESYIDLFESVDLTPVAFDLESQAIARAVVPQGNRQSILIINLSERKTGLYIVEDGIVQFSLTPSFDPHDGRFTGGSSNLRAEIQKLFIFWNTRLDKRGIPEKKIERIIVTGPGASNSNFIESLLSGIEVPHFAANVWRNAFSLENWAPDLTFEESLGYATAVGLALGNRKAKNHV